MIIFTDADTYNNFFTDGYHPINPPFVLLILNPMLYFFILQDNEKLHDWLDVFFEL